MKVVLDIETIQAPREEWARLMGIDSVAPESCEGAAADDLFSHAGAREQREKEDERYERSSFDGTFSRIVCIGLLVFSDSMEYHSAVSWYGTHEEELLRRFWARLGELRPSLFITYNGLGFDLPFLKKRSIIHRVKPSMEISLARYRTEPVYDIMAVWSNWDMRGAVKLDVLARALHVETKSGSGSQVAEMWAQGQRREIAEYCLRDTYVTYACYQRMTFRSVLGSDALLENPELIEVS